MSAQTRELYHSANGDRWCLAHDPAVGRVFVRHEPNPSSGGKTSDIEIGTFLTRGGQGPENKSFCGSSERWLRDGHPPMPSVAALGVFRSILFREVVQEGSL